MNRRDALKNTGALGMIVAAGSGPAILVQAADLDRGRAFAADPRVANKLKPPRKGKIPVAFLISRGATVIDFTGPWEVFQDVHVPGRGQTMDEIMPFELFTVSDTTTPIQASGGLKIVPNYTFSTVPEPRVVVIPAQGGRSAAMKEWLRAVSKEADVTMSVCTGAFVLAWAGLLSGKPATTHHDFLDRFAQEYPDIEVKRGLRFVEGPKISTAAGLTSGIDLALRVVERYFGREVVQATATYMEYECKGWML